MKKYIVHTTFLVEAENQKKATEIVAKSLDDTKGELQFIGILKYKVSANKDIKEKEVNRDDR